MDNRPIGVFDSGIGGLSLVSEIKRQLPEESVIYFADVARQPFGEKTKDEVIQISCEIADFLVSHGVKAIVIACSTASAAALSAIKSKFDLPVIGIITGRLVADIRKTTRNKKIGIISTELTAKTGSFKTAIQAADPDMEIFSAPCSKLVNMISEGDIFDEKIHSAAREAIAPLVKEGIDTLILGCTHFNSISGIIAESAGENIKIVSPPFSTIAFLKDILRKNDLLSFPDNLASYRYVATGDSASFSALVEKLWSDGRGAKIESLAGVV